MSLARLLAGLVQLANAILGAIQRAQDREAGREQVRADQLRTAARVLEEQRDEASRPPDDWDARLKRMREGGL